MWNEEMIVRISNSSSEAIELFRIINNSLQYSNVNIGPVHKRDVQKAAVMMEHNPEWVIAVDYSGEVSYTDLLKFT